MNNLWDIAKGKSNLITINSHIAKWGLKYVDIIPPQRGVQSITLNRIWWWGTSFEDLGSVKYLFMAITPRSTWNRSGDTC